jgi:hypothetical protein
MSIGVTRITPELPPHQLAYRTLKARWAPIFSSSSHRYQIQ